MPSSTEQKPEESQGCIEGVLVDIDQGSKGWKGSLEVCLAEEKGEELDLIVWEEVINDGRNVREFRIVMGREQPEKKDRAVQTELSGGPGEWHGLLKDFPNLQLGGGLLPDPKDYRARGDDLEPIEWTVVVYPRNQCGGRRVIHPSPSLPHQPHEGDWVRHPCCGTTCAMRSTPLRPVTDREQFGLAPL